MSRILLFLGLLAIPSASSSQSDARAEILVLGTYHMANPGRDIHNMEADDVQSPKRQQEIAQLIEVLKRFRPTKIAIEAEVADFPFYRVRNYAKANGLAEKFEAMQATVGVRVKAQGDFLRSHTVLQALEYINADSMVAKAMASEYAYVPFGEPYEYAGPDLLAAWFQRNIRIYRNIIALVESPNDRILAIYGAGHLGWLRQSIANDGTARLRKLADFAGQQ